MGAAVAIVVVVGEESPSLWIAEEKFLKREGIAGYKGQWPERMWVA